MSNVDINYLLTEIQYLRKRFVSLENQLANPRQTILRLTARVNELERKEHKCVHAKQIDYAMATLRILNQSPIKVTKKPVQGRLSI